MELPRGRLDVQAAARSSAGDVTDDAAALDRERTAANTKAAAAARLVALDRRIAQARDAVREAQATPLDLGHVRVQERVIECQHATELVDAAAQAHSMVVPDAAPRQCRCALAGFVARHGNSSVVEYTEASTILSAIESDGDVRHGHFAHVQQVHPGTIVCPIVVHVALTQLDGAAASNVDATAGPSIPRAATGSIIGDSTGDVQADEPDAGGALGHVDDTNAAIPMEHSAPRRIGAHSDWALEIQCPVQRVQSRAQDDIVDRLVVDRSHELPD